MSSSRRDGFGLFALATALGISIFIVDKAFPDVSSSALILCGVLAALLTAAGLYLIVRPGDAIRVGAESKISASTSGLANFTRLSVDDANPTDHDEWLITLPDFRITNATDAPMSVDVGLLLPCDDGEGGHWSEIREGEWRRRHVLPHQPENIDFQGPFLEGPFRVESRSTVRGKLGFLDRRLMDLPDETTKLRITDHLSGRTFEMAALHGRYPPEGEQMADEPQQTNVRSYNQSGGITAGTVNVSAPQASLSNRLIANNEPDSDGKGYITKAIFDVQAAHAANGIEVHVAGSCIEWMHFGPVGGGLVMGIQRDTTPTLARTRISAPLATAYEVVVKTREPDTLSIEARLEV